MSRFACKCCGVDLVTDRAKEAFLSLEALIGQTLTITSAYRCPRHNRAVGGSKYSRHTFAKDALDVLCKNDGARKRFIEEAIKLGFNGIGLGETFVHIDMRPNKMTWIYKK
jgi:uncharacterized protein YcbK (DUF882 family)